MNRKEIVSTIEKQKAVAVIRIPDSNLYEAVAEAMYEGGIRVSEITMTVPNAISLIKKAVANSPDDAIIGVGSVTNAEMTEKAVEAGAKFVVSPIMKKEIIDKANELDVPVMPGAFTPTEIQQAWDWGADIIKVFPANIVGMNFFKAVKAPLPHLKLMPTGGVSLTNGGEWIKAGACAVGVGSALLNKEAIKRGDFDTIRNNAQILLSNLGVE
ncbi:bifunctional 4-hydroxy-2-oxoglutarate aldolase/2-dehydro-3-deoxy-phosphogluconate aldolase [Rhodohalobacter sulfatireducens]|uniref:Bifunctional 4-hydroxy-2-oxoglutarate aldolase/2-dehydro-3-deoxy-phosphogluconate aldolase n=1 Tax=Rhodohalobacter sulfatireducens TaxID=2911366 RepID=A0ABS9KHJ1_9BACT|nr:bifunctional 4-hydroxy-2-oxoglutarate aldolase/2-dehydro-3-deoxy-phosphogluconate aldolase [Rhodohalobacter sulfatireducens]